MMRMAGILFGTLIGVELLIQLLKEYGIELRGFWKRLNEIFIYTVIFAIAEIFFWNNTQDIADFLLVNIMKEYIILQRKRI